MQLPTGNITKKNLELVTRFATWFCNSRIIDLHLGLHNVTDTKEF